MTESETSKQMWDSSEDISDASCLPVYGSGEYKVYTGTGWSAMRYVSLQEPVDDPPHFAEQSVIAFPNHDVAAKFFAGSEEDWVHCEDRQYTLKLRDFNIDTLWTVGQIENTGGSKSELRPPEMRGLRVCIRVARCYARAAHPRSFRPDARVRGEQ